ncbi:MAG TPA: MFS transporter [Bacteroidales bacterium]|nr:MFS transporter [Bacteroidales bacterium]HRZ77356.1 MFS transporter [Bacteroidales bacterium]
MRRIERVFSRFPRTFWVANAMELLERWAWYGMFMVLALYLTGSTDTGALGFSQQQKGLLMGTVVALLYFLPVVTGALADRFGYKRTLILAYVMLASGYYLMGQVRSYPMMYAVFLWLALGASLFKPIIAATVSKTTDEESSSIGFGIYYMMVNIGAFIGPIFASRLRLISWEHVFTMGAAVILVNLVLLLLLFREPAREKAAGRVLPDLARALGHVGTALRDWKFLTFLVIVVGFWTMYMQLFYTLPVFIDQWVDTGVVYDALKAVSPRFAQAVGTPEGTISAELMTNIDAMYIILFQVLVSYGVMRMRPLNAMVAGIFVSALGIGLSFMFQNGMFLFVSIFIFGIGEMASSPKITEYVGRIAPQDKTALYMGASFLPLAGGNFLAGLLSGGPFARMSDKITLLGEEAEIRRLDLPPISDGFSSNDYFMMAAERMGMTPHQLTDHLWATYHPQNIWMLFTAIGVATAGLLWLFDRMVMRDKPPGK